MQTSNHHKRERQRLDFSKIQSSIDIPNLIEVQRNSYQRFLQMDLLPSEREDAGLQSVFQLCVSDFRISADCLSWTSWTTPSTATRNASAAT